MEAILLLAISPCSVECGREIDYLVCIEVQAVCQLLLKLLISLTQTHKHITTEQCIIVLEIRREIWIIFYSWHPKGSYYQVKAQNTQPKQNEENRGKLISVQHTVRERNTTGQEGGNGRTQASEEHQAENNSTWKPSRAWNNTPQGLKDNKGWKLEPVCGLVLDQTIKLYILIYFCILVVLEWWWCLSR